MFLIKILFLLCIFNLLNWFFGFVDNKVKLFIEFLFIFCSNVKFFGLNVGLKGILVINVVVILLWIFICIWFLFWCVLSMVNLGVLFVFLLGNICSLFGKKWVLKGIVLIKVLLRLFFIFIVLLNVFIMVNFGFRLVFRLGVIVKFMGCRVVVN